MTYWYLHNRKFSRSLILQRTSLNKAPFEMSYHQLTIADQQIHSNYFESFRIFVFLEKPSAALRWNFHHRCPKSMLKLVQQYITAGNETIWYGLILPNKSLGTNLTTHIFVLSDLVYAFYGFWNRWYHIVYFFWCDLRKMGTNFIAKFGWFNKAHFFVW